MATNNKDDLARNKEMVLAAIKSINRGDKASQIVYTSKFKGFCKTDTMDAFLHACDDYFTIFFEVRTIEEEESAKNSAERRDALADGKGRQWTATPPTAPAALRARRPPRQGPQMRPSGCSKEEEKRTRLRKMALVYASILMSNSNYANTQQERQFFESVYDFAKRVLFTRNNRKHWHAIENELDRIFRSPHFNLSQRKNDQNLKGGSSTTQISFKEMYEKRLGTDGGHGSLGGSVSTRRSQIHQALTMRSPIISEIFPTAKDRAARAARCRRRRSRPSAPRSCRSLARRMAACSAPPASRRTTPCAAPAAATPTPRSQCCRARRRWRRRCRRRRGRLPSWRTECEMGVRRAVRCSTRAALADVERAPRLCMRARASARPLVIVLALASRGCARYHMEMHRGCTPVVCQQVLL